MIIALGVIFFLLIIGVILKVVLKKSIVEIIYDIIAAIFM